MKNYMLEECKRCEDASNFHYGIKGKRADETKLLIVGNRPDSRVEAPVLEIVDQYEAAFSKTRTCKNIGNLLQFLEMSWEDIYWTNLVKCTFPNDREPTTEEYKSCFEVLKKQIEEFDPRTILVMGEMPYKLMFHKESKKNSVSKMWGEILSYGKTPAMIAPHASRVCVPYCTYSEQERWFMKIKSFLRIS